MAIDTVADMTREQLETVVSRLTEVTGIWASNGTESTLTRYCNSQLLAAKAELANRTK